MTQSNKSPELGEELTITFNYGEPICNTCEHQEKPSREEPCKYCSPCTCFWEPKRSNTGA